MRLVPATQDLVDRIAGKLRDADIEEWQAAAPGYPVEALLKFCLQRDTGSSRAVLDECGYALCFWGVTPSGVPGVGLAWMVATDAALRRVHSLHRFFKQGIAEMHEVYPKLEAYAYIKNTVHHEWMKRVGFEFSHAGCFPGTSYDYLKFIRHKEPPCVSQQHRP